MNEILLHTEHVTKTYGKQKALDDVSITLRRGEIYGLVGNNGAGKTTLMRLIAGQSPMEQGELALFGGKTGEELRRNRRRMGTLIETPGFFSYLTAEENLEYFRLQFGIPGKDLVKRTLEEVGLGEAGKKKYKGFSLGMKQRLGMALAILHSPELLVLDEPINGLDPEGILEIRSLLLRLNQKKNVTILISSHILPELSSIATRYGFLKNGVLLEELSAQELLSKCSVYLELKVSDAKRALTVLETRLGIQNYQVLPDGILHVFERLEETDRICRELVLADIGLFSVYRQSIDLESYYVNLMGGVSK